MQNLNTKKTYRRGFTLVELLVAMGVTSVIVLTLLSVTRVALDTWRDSRNEVRTSRIAKELLDQIAADFQTMVVREGNDYEWFYIESDAINTSSASNPLNTVNFGFYNIANDRYNGVLAGTAGHEGGDVSSVHYRMVYQDPISQSSTSDYAVYGLYRHVIDPNDTFDSLLTQQDLGEAYSNGFSSDAQENTNFLVENVFGINASVLFEVSAGAGGAATSSFEKVTIGRDVQGGKNRFSWTGNGIEIDGIPEIWRPVSVEFSVTILTEAGAERTRGGVSGNALSDNTRDNSLTYSRTIELPRL